MSASFSFARHLALNAASVVSVQLVTSAQRVQPLDFLTMRIVAQFDGLKLVLESLLVSLFLRSGLIGSLIFRDARIFLDELTERSSFVDEVYNRFAKPIFERFVALRDSFLDATAGLDDALSDGVRIDALIK